MEKKTIKTIFWMVGIIVVALVIFNLGDFTANVAKSGTPAVKQPVLRTLTPQVSAGSNLIVSVANIRSLTSSRLYVYSEGGRYSGVSFPIGRGDCKLASAGYYDCETSFNFPVSELLDGRYFVQVKSDAAGELIGNKAFFTLSDSKYQETGR